MKNKLIPLSQFVNNIDELVPRDLSVEFIIWERSKLRVIKNYSAFLSQPLKLEYFVPCDAKGNFLKGKPLSPAEDSEWIRWGNEQEEFFKAREKVLFEGFIGTNNYGQLISTYPDGGIHLNKDEFDYNTLEYIAGCDIILSATALKQIYE